MIRPTPRRRVPPPPACRFKRLVDSWRNETSTVLLHQAKSPWHMSGEAPGGLAIGPVLACTVPCPCGPVETLGSEDQDTTPTEQLWHSMRTTPQPQSGCMAVLAPSSLRMGRIIGIDQSSNDGRNIWNHSTGTYLQPPLQLPFLPPPPAACAARRRHRFGRLRYVSRKGPGGT